MCTGSTCYVARTRCYADPLTCGPTSIIRYELTPTSMSPDLRTKTNTPPLIPNNALEAPPRPASPHAAILGIALSIPSSSQATHAATVTLRTNARGVGRSKYRRPGVGCWRCTMGDGRWIRR